MICFSPVQNSAALLLSRLALPVPSTALYIVVIDRSAHLILICKYTWAPQTVHNTPVMNI